MELTELTKKIGKKLSWQSLQETIAILLKDTEQRTPNLKINQHPIKPLTVNQQVYA